MLPTTSFYCYVHIAYLINNFFFDFLKNTLARLSRHDFYILGLGQSCNVFPYRIVALRFSYQFSCIACTYIISQKIFTWFLPQCTRPLFNDNYYMCALSFSLNIWMQWVKRIVNFLSNIFYFNRRIIIYTSV